MYTLVIALLLNYAGPGQNTATVRSVAVTHIAGFQTKAACEVAGAKERKAFSGTVGRQEPMSEGTWLAVQESCVKTG